jgi:hypothetical protein
MMMTVIKSEKRIIGTKGDFISERNKGGMLTANLTSPSASGVRPLDTFQKAKGF